MQGMTHPAWFTQCTHLALHAPTADAPQRKAGDADVNKIPACRSGIQVTWDITGLYIQGLDIPLEIASPSIGGQFVLFPKAADPLFEFFRGLGAPSYAKPWAETLI